MNIDVQKLQELLDQRFNFEEIRQLTFDMGIEYEDLAGENKKTKVRELIIYLQRRNRLEELVSIASKHRPQIDWMRAVQEISPSEISDPTLDANILILELASLRQQLDEIKKGTITDEQLKNRLEEMVKTTSRAIGRSEELTARVILPPSELTDVQLLPSGMLERLEEYRSDENLAYLLIGAFSGAILGIFSNWATNSPFVITSFSVVFLVLFFTLALLSALWARRLQKRANLVKEQIFSKNVIRSETT
jgi:VIT1/CCC1 family predicted Fe2+/Mn2+ transporter